MRILSFSVNGSESFGLAKDGGVVDCGRRLSGVPGLLECLQGDGLASLAAFAAEQPDYALDELRWRPLIPSPATRFFCVGINYRPHMLEVGRDLPPYPVIFVRFAQSLVGHQEPLVCPRVSEKFDYEGELAVIIGQRARHVSAADALDYVAGYSCFNDAAVRDYQRHSGQFTPGKNFDRSGSFGPWLVTRDEVPDPHSLQLETRLNGDIVQSESTGELIFPIGELIAYLSQWTELQPGDVIATGTPGGVALGRNPPRWLRPGDTVEVELEGIGCLRNGVVAEDA